MFDPSTVEGDLLRLDLSRLPAVDVLIAGPFLMEKLPAVSTGYISKLVDVPLLSELHIIFRKVFPSQTFLFIFFVFFDLWSL